MPVAARQLDLWALVLDSLTVDAGDLTRAIDAELGNPTLDFRTRLLIRDSLQALAGRGVAALPLLSPSSQARAEQLLAEDLGPARFPSLSARVMDHTRPEKILAFLRELGTACELPSRIEIGGSSSLILRNLLDRYTEDVDAVNEIPYTLRISGDLIDRLAARYGLRLTHFQSHYLPDGWEGRLESLGTFGRLIVDLVDPIDIVVGKVFSHREKDMDDVRVMKPLLEWAAVTERVSTSAGSLRTDVRSLEAAKRNWYVLTGDGLPPAR